jgi:hypothetical protein
MSQRKNSPNLPTSKNMKVKKIKNILLHFWLSKKFFNLTIENLKRKPHDFSKFSVLF